jgi:hypothetical protein
VTPARLEVAIVHDHVAFGSAGPAQRTVERDMIMR